MVKAISAVRDWGRHNPSSEAHPWVQLLNTHLLATIMYDVRPGRKMYRIIDSSGILPSAFSESVDRWQHENFSQKWRHPKDHGQGLCCQRTEAVLSRCTALVTCPDFMFLASFIYCSHCVSYTDLLEKPFGNPVSLEDRPLNKLISLHSSHDRYFLLSVSSFMLSAQPCHMFIPSCAMSALLLQVHLERRLARYGLHKTHS